MSQLPILGYKRYPLPCVPPQKPLKPPSGKGTVKPDLLVGGLKDTTLGYIADELQRLENSLNTNNEVTKTVNDGVTTVVDTLIDLEVRVDDDFASIFQELILQVGHNFALAQLITELEAQVVTDFSINTARFDNTITTMATADFALSSEITNLSATVVSNEASFIALNTAEALARSTLTDALASNLNTLTATVTTGDASNAAAITTEHTARVNADESLTLISNTQRALFGAAVSDNWDEDAEYIGSTIVVGGNTVGTGDDVVSGGFIYRCKVTHNNAGDNYQRRIPPNTFYWDRVDTVDAKVTAAVLVESTARSTAELAQAATSAALSGRVATSESDININAGDIVTTNELIVTKDESYAERFELTAARFGVTVADTYDNARTYQVGEEVIHLAILYRCKAISSGNLPTETVYWDFQELVPAAISAAVQSEANARTTADTAQANTTNAISGRVTTLEDDTTDADAIAVNAADIITIEQVVVTNEAASAEKFDLTSARLGITVPDNYDSAREYQVGEEAVYLTILYRCTAITTGNIPTNTLYWAFQELVPAAISAAVQTESEARVAADGTLLAKYGVTLNANNYITGFSQNNDGTTGSFKIIADDFRIIDPSSNAGEAGTQVFTVIDGVVTINGDLIVNGSIYTDKIANNAVSNVASVNIVGLANETVTSTTLVNLLTLTFTGSGSTAEVLANIGADGSGKNYLQMWFYLNGSLVNTRNYSHGGVEVFQTTTAVGSNTLVMKGRKSANTSGNAIITEAYMRILELKK